MPSITMRLQPGSPYGVMVRGINRGYLVGPWSETTHFSTISSPPPETWNVSAEYRVGGVKVVGARQSAIPNHSDTTGTANDGEARAKINQILAALRAHGLIAT